MEIKWLNDFLVLSSEGNFRVAAGLRHVSQPAFSRRIQALESWVGAQLVDRSTQPSHLTEAGKLFLPVAQQIVNLAEEGKDTIQTQVLQENEKITFATLGALAQAFIPVWLKKLQPLIAVQNFGVRTEYSSIEEYFHALEQREVDFFICYEKPQAKLYEDGGAFTSMKLGEETLIPVVSPDESGAPAWWLSAGVDETIPSGEAIPCLHCLPKSSPWPIGNHMAEKYGHINFRSVYNSSLGPTLRAMAVEGFGLAWIPYTIVKHDLANGRLVRAAESGDDIHVEIIIYRRTNSHESKVENFWQALLQQAHIQNDELQLK